MMKVLTPNLMVDDVNQTVEYYCQHFGCELVMSVPETGVFDWALVAVDEISFMFQSRSSLAADLPELADVALGGSLLFYIDVEDIELLYERLRGRPELVKELHTTFYGNREFVFRDPSGYLLVFNQASNDDSE